jgi:hypothetical protein
MEEQIRGSNVLDSIEFHKYTALGNNFTLIDELNGIVLDERDKFRFAHRLNLNVGTTAQSIKSLDRRR